MAADAVMLGRKVVFKPGDVLKRVKYVRDDTKSASKDNPNRWWQRHREWSPDYAVMHQLDDDLDTGTIVGRRTLSNGVYKRGTAPYLSGWDEDGGDPDEYTPVEAIIVYAIARTLYSKPVYVRAEDIVEVLDGPHELIAKYDTLLVEMAKLLNAHRESAITKDTTGVIFGGSRQSVEDARMGYRLAIKHMNDVINKTNFGAVQGDPEVRSAAESDEALKVGIERLQELAREGGLSEGFDKGWKAKEEALRLEEKRSAAAEAAPSDEIGPGTVRFKGPISDLYCSRADESGQWGPWQRVEVHLR